MSATAHNPGDLDTRSWPLTIGFALSVLLHASVVFWFVSVGATLGATGPMNDPELFEKPKSPIVELGEPDSEATTITWIGYTEYEEHLTRQSETEQALADLATESSAPTVDEGDELTATAPVIVEAVPSIVEAPALPDTGETEDAQPSAETVAQDVAPEPVPADRPVFTERPPDEPTAQQEIVVAPSEQPRVEPEVGPLPSETTEQPELTVVEDAPTDTPADAAPPELPVEPETPEEQLPAVVVEPPAPGTTPGGKAGDATTGTSIDQPSAIPTDRESVATAIKDSAEYKPGKPLASRGLRITTVRPDLSHFTALFASYQDPVARIFFARDGRVVDVHLLQESGHRDVDRNTLDALYRWKAEGELLKQLRPGVVEPGTNRLLRGDDLAVGVFHRLGVETVAVDIQIIVR